MSHIFQSTVVAAMCVSFPSQGVWSPAEHERFLQAIAEYPRGPWTLIQERIGTRSVRQVQTHARKYQLKLVRHQRGLRKHKTKFSRVEHRIDNARANEVSDWPPRRNRRSTLRPSPSPAASVSSDSPEAHQSDCGDADNLYAYDFCSPAQLRLTSYDPLPFDGNRCVDSASILESLHFLQTSGLCDENDLSDSAVQLSFGPCVVSEK